MQRGRSEVSTRLGHVGAGSASLEHTAPVSLPGDAGLVSGECRPKWDWGAHVPAVFCHPPFASASGREDGAYRSVGPGQGGKSPCPLRGPPKLQGVGRCGRAWRSCPSVPAHLGTAEGSRIITNSKVVRCFFSRTVTPIISYSVRTSGQMPCQ